MLTHFFSGGKLLFFQFCLADPLNFTDSEGLSAACQRKAHALFSCSAGTADTMHIIFDILRNVIIDNAIHIVYIDSSRRNIRCDQHLEITASETVHDRISLCLAQIAMQPFCRDASVFQILCQLVHHTLGVAENQSSFQVIIFNQPCSCSFLIRSANIIKILPDSFYRQFLFDNLYHFRIGLELIGDL